MNFQFEQVRMSIHPKRNQTSSRFCEIYFTCAQKNFYLYATHITKDVWYVSYIGHTKSEKENNCPFCKREENKYVCTELEKMKNNVFQQLINHPSIRTRWLLQTR